MRLTAEISENVCMDYIRIYLFICVCIYVFMCMDVCMYVCECMCVCVCVYDYPEYNNALDFENFLTNLRVSSLPHRKHFILQV
jgi:hypothetical protein